MSAKPTNALIIKIADDVILQPDLLVICSKIQKPYLDFAPSLVAEILSPATALKDRHTKYQIYLSQSIPYYIIISPDTEKVEVFVPENENYQLTQKRHAFNFTFLFNNNCQADIDFNEIWQ